MTTPLILCISYDDVYLKKDSFCYSTQTCRRFFSLYFFASFLGSTSEMNCFGVRSVGLSIFGHFRQIPRSLFSPPVYLPPLISCNCLPYPALFFPVPSPLEGRMRSGFGSMLRSLFILSSSPLVGR